MVVDRPDGRLHVEISGSAGPAVLLLGGAGLDNARLSWKRLMPRLAERYRVFAPDWPKQGLSTPWTGRADHGCLMDCVLTLMDRFGMERAAIVGLSQGGAIALSLAIDHPDRVERIVAIAPAGIIRFPPGLHQALWAAGRMPWLTSVLSGAMLRSRRGVERFVRQALFAGPSPDFEDVVDDICEEIRRNGVRASDWQNDSIGFLGMKVNLLPRLPDIRCPVLFVQGDKDVAVRPRFTQEAARRVPNARYVLLEGHGHWPNRQSPDRIAGLIEEFLAEPVREG